MRLFLKVTFILPFLWLVCVLSPAWGESPVKAGQAAQQACQFEPPNDMLHRLAKRYDRYQNRDVISYLEYYHWLTHEDQRRLEGCEQRQIKTKKFLALSKEKQKILMANYKASLGPGIEGGDLTRNGIVMMSMCQMHACIDNIHSDIFDKEGNLVGMILYFYPIDPQQASASPYGRDLGHVLKSKAGDYDYSLEAWIAVRKESNTPEMQAFLKEALAHFQKGSGATITSIHDLSD